MHEVLHTSLSLALPRRCAEPRSRRNPFKDRCHLPAGHSGAHQWDREASRRDFVEVPLPTADYEPGSEHERALG
jgi:hypothetical protein